MMHNLPILLDETTRRNKQMEDIIYRVSYPGGTGAGHGLRAGRMGRERVSQTRRESRMRFTERRFPKGPTDVPVEVPVPVVPDWTGAGAACGAGVMAWERGAGAGERGRGVR